VTMSWSSSGPAVYAHSLTKGSKSTRAYIAMSVFRPKRLPDIANATGHRYVIDHSRQDKVCPYLQAQQAREVLKNAGATILSIDYTGGHGWLDDPFSRMKKGLNWLVE
jgi:predicted esterase